MGRAVTEKGHKITQQRRRWVVQLQQVQASKIAMAPPPPCLPTDCLLHVFLRLDPISIVRCGAVSRHWRRGVTDNASDIWRHTTGHADRCLLLGLHCPRLLPPLLMAAFARAALDALLVPMTKKGCTKPKLHAPLACSDGLLLICRGLPTEMSVVNPLTGFHVTMPRPTSAVAAYSRYFLHSCHGAKPNSFEVLAVDRHFLAIQNYCSETGAWGLVFHPKTDDHGLIRLPGLLSEYPAAPLVCQGAIHWLCSYVSVSDYYSLGERKLTHVVAVDIATGRTRMTRIPSQCSMCSEDVSTRKTLMLATSEDDQPSLLRTEEASLKVSFWLYVGDHGGGNDDDTEKSWLLRRSMDIRKLIEDAGLSSAKSGR
ncbi:hypothetical protein HU200_045377 [Digitaria exilis]|uniref:F-box domain-containing protein n=1 Tax=Digitaria exilis TaxID=1010633 RepID=A0A835EC89_9POAL|nr:hypothetical protein HU200_045377 [Digitaria exilis]